MLNEAGMEGQMTETTLHVPLHTDRPPLGPVTQEFVDGATVCHSKIDELTTIGAARATLAAMQAKPTGKSETLSEAFVAPVRPKGFVSLHLMRPPGIPNRLPVIMLFRGGGWAPRDASTRDRLARELAAGIRVSVVIVEFSRTPESRFPIAIEEAYAATRYIAENSASSTLDKICPVVEHKCGNAYERIVAPNDVRFAKDKD
jgi:acetyl esterase